MNGAEQGFDYLGSLVYNRNGASSSLESAAFGAGRIIKTSTGYEVRYFLTDHLGSVRASVNQAGQVTDRSDYQLLGERWSGAGVEATTNRYQFNGKESQTLLSDANGISNFLDYGARHYNSNIGRWFTPDPLSGKYLNLSPYNYCAANPIKFVDPDGQQIDIATVKKDNRTYVTITYTGKVVIKTGSDYPKINEYVDKMARGMERYYTREYDNMSVTMKVNLTLATEDNPLKKSDHAIEIHYDGNLPGNSSSTASGLGSVGGRVLAISSLDLGEYDATEGEYVGTDKTDYGVRSMQGTVAHELGHNLGLTHPKKGTEDANLMHQGKEPNSGGNITKQQIQQVLNAYWNNQLNQGLNYFRQNR